MYTNNTLKTVQMGFSKRLREDDIKLIYALTRAIIRQELGHFYNKIYIDSNWVWYFIYKDEVKDYARVEPGNEYGLTVPTINKVFVFIDDLVPLHPSNYFMLSELTRRISHELTHAFACFLEELGKIEHEDTVKVHRYIDAAVREGAEAEKIIWHNGVRGLLRVYKLKCYAVKPTIAKAIGYMPK
ncbi:MAG: hypothetical protein QXI92_05415 [Candidatus Nitrosocaldus sp.]